MNLKFPVTIKGADNKDYAVHIWAGERLGKDVCLDFETDVHPFHTRLNQAVVLQAYSGSNEIYLVRIKDIKRFLNLHYTSHLIFHNAPFDVQVFINCGYQDRIIEYFEDNRVWDTKTMYILYYLAQFGDTPNEKSLLAATKDILGTVISKDNDIRTTFGDYLGQDYEKMPIDHLAYAALDVVYTYNLFVELKKLINKHDLYGTWLTHHTQVKSDFVLDQIGKNGIAIDVNKKNFVKEQLESQMFDINLRMSTWGVVKGQAGVATHYEYALKLLGIYNKLPKTATRKVTQSNAELVDYRHIQFIDDWCKYSELESLYKYVAKVDGKMTFNKYDNLKVTGRTGASAGYNGIPIHQLPREGGIRDLFIPRSNDNVFIDVDYDGIELSALSEVLLHFFRQSRMAEILNSGKCLHVATAASMFNKDPGLCTKEDMGQVTKEERQAGKAPNFSFGANASEDIFIATAKKDYNQVYNLDQAKAIKKAWIQAYPEVESWFREPFMHKDGEVFDPKKGRNKATYGHYTLTGRKKSFSSYTEWLNCHFQGLAADGLKIALWNLWLAGYTIVSTVHDNITVEVPRHRAKKDLYRVCKIMVESMKTVIPNVRVGVEGAAVCSLGKDEVPIHKLNLNSIELENNG